MCPWLRQSCTPGLPSRLPARSFESLRTWNGSDDNPVVGKRPPGRYLRTPDMEGAVTEPGERLSIAGNTDGFLAGTVESSACT